MYVGSTKAYVPLFRPSVFLSHPRVTWASVGTPQKCFPGPLARNVSLATVEAEVTQTNAKIAELLRARQLETQGFYLPDYMFCSGLFSVFLELM